MEAPTTQLCMSNHLCNAGLMRSDIIRRRGLGNVYEIDEGMGTRGSTRVCSEARVHVGEMGNWIWNLGAFYHFSIKTELCGVDLGAMGIKVMVSLASGKINNVSIALPLRKGAEKDHNQGTIWTYWKIIKICNNQVEQNQFAFANC